MIGYDTTVVQWRGAIMSGMPCDVKQVGRYSKICSSNSNRVKMRYEAQVVVVGGGGGFIS